MTRPLLDVEGLTKHYPVTEGVLRKEVGRVRAVDGISFTVDRGETLGLVGESGCGKSTAARATLRLEEPTDGHVVFDGEDVTDYDNRALTRFRRRAQMVFQDPTSSFDPRMSIGESVAEPLQIHGVRDRERRRRIVADLLDRVGLDAADVDRYPHELSGGQKQRVGLARALVCNPDLIVADEPVSALDVSVQADILDLIDRLQQSFGLALVVISHDLGVVREVCDRVAVMYLGEIVETAPTEELFEDPRHPYTRALLGSTPVADPRRRGQGTTLTGDVPSPSDPPPGCRFHTRCPEVIPDEDYDLDSETWRAVLDFRLRVLADGVDIEAARTYAAADDDPAAADPDAVRAAIREEFGVPATLSDGKAEAAVADALDSLVADDVDGAADRLADAFPTVCRRERPDLAPATGAVDSETWAAIKRLRVWVATRVDAGEATVRDHLERRCANEADRAGEVDRLAVRAAFRLPDPISDGDAERAVGDAIDALLAGQAGAAADELYEAFGGVRERACHLED
ncbi:peptide/nickel transport system ATP-binding protein [Haloplanus vescus]|uniref:Peptide/nickel transport system ATP-binding protein n=1 Tax=Haloplanus vescus TaxID=555874 RepID=A0A1H3W2K1_9EURY|nr:peptide/nickel transport system ATP-binding protein [Haloplanus vescus]